VKQGRKFIHETQVYKMLAAGGVKVPKYAVVNETSDLERMPFFAGEKVVVKGIADELWHKSDHGALKFLAFDKAAVADLHDSIKQRLHEDGYADYIETLVCACVDFKSRGGLPCEGFVSVKWEDSCGYVIRMGIGGIHAEFWAKELSSGVLSWPVAAMTPEVACEQLKNHVLGRIWLGTIRQSSALTDEANLLGFLRSMWAATGEFAASGVALLEMNPVVVDSDGAIVALDGVGEYGAPAHAEMHEARQIPRCATLLSPRTIAIAGVSSQAGSFGRVIFENMLKSDINKAQLRVIKPGVEQMAGVRCYEDVSSLKNDPVDALILALPAAVSCKTIIDLCAQGGGAEVVYLVAGGIGDGADKEGHGRKMMEIVASRRAAGEYAPFLVGPNSLGTILSPLKLNTLFISGQRLPVRFHAAGNIGFVSQSGAFFISRLSKECDLPIKYGYCIGNQIDVKLADFLSMFGQDDSIKVIGVYAEGFSHMDAANFAEVAKGLIGRGRHVILYKGGRSSEGMKAASGHTGAMASDYGLHKALFKHVGIKIAETFQEFSAALAFYGMNTECQKVGSIGAISNAGYETVGIADFLGGCSMIHPFEGRDKDALEAVIKENKLEGLVSVANPLDVTPMASERVYSQAIRVMALGDVDAVVAGIVPLTEKLDVFDESKATEFARELRQISLHSGKPVTVVIDSGVLYDQYAQLFMKEGLAVFRSMDIALSVFRL
jgi:acyl-CoA synthetase (NDP forming)